MKTNETEFTLTADEVRLLAPLIGDHAQKMLGVIERIQPSEAREAADRRATRYADLAHRLETAAHRCASQDASGPLC
jgi:hypothetical protein